jgi:hypothetical protein
MRRKIRGERTAVEIIEKGNIKMTRVSDGDRKKMRNMIKM